MKTLVSKNIHSNPNYTLLLGFYTFMMLLYFIGDIFYMLNFFGFTAQEVLSTLKGNEEEYIEALSLVSVLEHFHISLFLAILAIFTTMAIILRINLRYIHKQVIILISMGSLLLSFLSLLGTYFLLDMLVYPFILFSLLWHFVGIYALSIILYKVGLKKA